MAEDTLLEPLKGYNSVYKEKHKQLCEDFFDELVKKSQINIEENRATVKKYNAKMAEVNELNKKLGKFKFLKIFLLILGFGLLFATLIVIIAAVQKSIKVPLSVILPIIFIIIGTVCLVFGFGKVSKIVKDVQVLRDKKQSEANKIQDEAYAQMAPLNALYDWGISEKIFSSTVPDIKMDQFFDNKKYAYLRDQYGYHFQDEENMSTYLCQSGSIAGNPFLLCTDYIQEFRPRVYTGTLPVTYYVTVTDKDGHTHREARTQILTASVVEPEPYYYYDTYLVYGNDAAPDLIFSRNPSGVSGKSQGRVDKYVKSRTKGLEKQARKAIKQGSNYTKLGNDEFEAIFGGENRNNEVQFRLLFTPLAQKSLLDLIKTPVPFGDDFSFIKHEKVNIIHSAHSQHTDYYSTPLRYVTYDYDAAKSQFMSFNEQFFKGLYFDLAPLMSVPLYQQHKSVDYIYNEQKETNVSEYEHESIANSFSMDTFRPAGSDTSVILKCDYMGKEGNVDIVKVRGHSFEGYKRVTYVPRMARDGHVHLVPVFWIEYLPVHSESKMMVQQLNTTRQEFNGIRGTESFNQSINAFGTDAYVYERGLFASVLGDRVTPNAFKQFNKAYEATKTGVGIMVASEILASLDKELKKDQERHDSISKGNSGAESKLNDKNVECTEKDAKIVDEKSDED